MKKTATIIIIITLLLALTVSFFGCEKKVNLPNEITITFVSNSPNINIEPIVLNGIDKVFMPSDPVRADYKFIGWYYNEELTDLFSVDDGLTDNITLYAKWNDISGFESVTNPPIYVESGSFTYNETSDYYIITKYNGTEGQIVIPDSYNKKPVVEIASNAFKDNFIIEKITIGSVLQKIGDNAFLNCNHLSEFLVSGSDYFASEDGVLYNRDKNSILQVGMAKNTANFVIAKEITLIRQGAFSGTNFEIIFENGGLYNEIAENDFSGFTGTLRLNGNITKIAKLGLNGFLGELIFDETNNISTITMGAFDGYHGETVVLPSKITQLLDFAFSGCKSIIDMRNLSITKIPNKTFLNYTGDSIIIPNTVTSIGEDAFHFCTAEVSFMAGSTLKTLEYLSFSMFMGNVFLPESVDEIKNNAFFEIRSQAEVYFAKKRSEVSIDSSYVEEIDNSSNIHFIS